MHGAGGSNRCINRRVYGGMCVCVLYVYVSTAVYMEICVCVLYVYVCCMCMCMYHRCVQGQSYLPFSLQSIYDISLCTNICVSLLSVAISAAFLSSSLSLSPCLPLHVLHDYMYQWLYMKGDGRTHLESSAILHTMKWMG